MTDNRDTTQKIENGRQVYRIISEYTSDLVCLHNADGRYAYVSPSVRKVLGYAPEELVGKSPDELIHPDDLERERQMQQPTLFGIDSSDTVVYRARHKDGSYRWLETGVSFVADKAGEIEYVVTSSRDISERIEVKRKAERMNQTLEQRNRELQDFAYVASHDLQEPLRKIRAFADLLREDYEEKVDETGQYYLSRMQDAAARMSKLITDLLAFSRVSTRTRPFEEVDLNKIVNHVISDLEIQISDVEGAVQVGELPIIEADRTQMRQLLQNLISNALKFRRPDVRPVIEISSESVTEAETEIGNSVDSWRILIKDNGIGFEEKYLERIFTPFERLHRRGAYEGTGMGLAISRRIVERHGGEITARSAPNEGTTFFVTLPRTQSNSSRAMETSE